MASKNNVTITSKNANRKRDIIYLMGIKKKDRGKRNVENPRQKGKLELLGE